MKSEPRIPQQERSIEKKEYIINAGLKLFSDIGYHKTNTKEIAKAAGVSTGTFYAYFTDKRDLFMEVFSRYNGKISKVLSSIPVEEYRQPGRERDFILHLVETLLDAHNISPAFHQELESMIHSDEEVGRIMESIRDNSIKLTREILKNWQSSLRPGNINAASIIIQSTIEDIVHAIKFTKLDVKPVVLKNELVDMIHRYLFD
ncbi:MAG TPA: TetR/AcrR family transcriptional regulator [Spirochaetota bacterium]|nr:TetR/AcrR family transcriptional regulator [Spirochaetota bacterium]HPJ33720.1 TetR/AcrR family transcriptional regulator [Spirochaetota bacterium]